MPLVNMSDMLKHAYRNGYAVGCFDLISLDFLDAIIGAAETTRSPVILSIPESLSDIFNLDTVIATTEHVAKRASVPIAIHFNHGTSYKSAVRAINAGCNSIMVNALHENFPTNVTNTAKLVSMAHACGIAVEGRIGNNSTNETTQIKSADEKKPLREYTQTTVAEANAFVERTHVDFLALDISVTQTISRKRSKLDLDRLKRINETIKIPLVVDYSSALSDEQIHKLIINGVAKINYCTDIDNIIFSKIRSKFKPGNKYEYSEIVEDVRKEIRLEIERCMFNWGSAGRAAEVLARCRLWAPIQHVIIYNVNNINISETNTIISKGKSILSGIPGVRRVIAGSAVSENARFKFCWLIEFVHQNVIDSYRDNPEHVEFANELFRPIASDRISVDFSESHVSFDAIKPQYGITASA